MILDFKKIQNPIQDNHIYLYTLHQIVLLIAPLSHFHLEMHKKRDFFFSQGTSW